jgi:hypothetical protein
VPSASIRCPANRCVFLKRFNEVIKEFFRAKSSNSFSLLKCAMDTNFDLSFLRRSPQPGRTSSEFGEVPTRDASASLWSPAPVPPTRFERAPSSRVRVHDHRARVRPRHIGHAIRGWLDDYGRRWHGCDDYRRRQVRCAGIINDLRTRAGHTDQSQCGNYSCQHPHCSASPNSLPPTFHPGPSRQMTALVRPILAS